MKRDEVKAIFPDATDDQITTLLNKQGAEVESWKTQYNTANDALTELQSKGNIDDVRTELETYKNKVAEYEANAAKAAQEAELSKRFASAHGGKKFVNSYTEEGLLGAFKAEIAKPENQGKADADIYSAITKDRTDLYANDRQNPDIPGTGAGIGKEYTKEDAVQKLLDRSPFRK